MIPAISSEVLARGREPHPLRFSELRIENTNACGYDCFFCPRESLTRKQGVMPLDDLVTVLDRVGEHRGSVDLHGFGEPLLDRSLVDKVALVRERWPETRSRIFSTLGVPVKPGYFERLAAAGLDCIEVSFYGFDRETYEQVHHVDRYDLARANLESLCEVARASAGELEVIVRAFPSHPRVKQPGADRERIERFTEWLQALGVEVIRERDLHNYGDGRAYNRVESEVPCSVAWGLRRRILQVTWDLYVIPCCFDSNATVKLGNLRHQTLEEIFHGTSYRDFVDDHLTNDLERYPVCQGCERCHAM